MSLLANQRSSIISDMENAQGPSTRQFGKRKRVPFYYPETSRNGHSEIGTHGDHNFVKLDDECAVESTLLKAHLRRIRNFYAILAEICQRDEKLLAI